MRVSARSFLRCVFAVVSVGLASLLHAQSTTKDFDLPAGPAHETLKKFSEQAAVQVLFPTDRVQGVRTNPVRANLAPADALEQMVAGTELVVIRDDRTGALGIRREVSIEIAEKNGASRLVRSDNQAALADTSVNGDKIMKLPEYMVTGTKTLNADVPRSRDDIQPYVVFDQRAITSSGAANIEQFLMSRLSLNSATITEDQNAATTNVQGSINLRGLGSNQTLILVDGRRLAGTPPIAIGFTQPNINGLPLASIDRIEILAAGAGAIYGGNATAGVINIILKRDYSGLDFQLSYGNAFDTDVGRIDFAVSGGVSLRGGKTRLSFSASHSEGNDLLDNDRNFSTQARRLLFVNSPTSITTASSGVVGNRSNIFRSSFGSFLNSPLTLDNGQSLMSPITSVPAGYAGPGSDAGLALRSNAGIYDISIPAAGLYLLRTPNADSFRLDLQNDFAKSVSFYGTAMWNRREGVTTVFNQAPRVALTFQGNDPLNPFQEEVRVVVPVIGLVPPSSMSSKRESLTVGAIFKLSKEWKATLEQNWNRVTSQSDFVSSAAVSDNGLAALRQTAFRDNGIQDVSAYLVPVSGSRELTPRVSTLSESSIRIGGGFLSLPAGQIGVSGSGSFRVEKSDDVISRSFFIIPGVLSSTSHQLTPSMSQSVTSFTSEFQVPLVGERQGARLIRALNVQIAARSDRYDIDSVQIPPTSTNHAGPYNFARIASRLSSDDFLIGANYTPAKDITFRTSYGTGYLVPGMHQFVSGNPINLPSSTILDPKRGLTPIGAYSQISGGNPTTRPETSGTWSSGVIIAPQTISGLRISVDYTRIEKTDEIRGLDGIYLVNNEALFPDRVTRGPKAISDPGDWAGPITGLDISLTNVTSSRYESLDLQADYKKEAGVLGVFEVGVVATRYLEYSLQNVVGGPVYDLVDYPSGVARWKGTCAIAWEHRSWTVGWNMQYLDGRYITSPTNTAATNEGLVRRQGSPRISSQVYHDVYVEYRITAKKSLLADCNISFGVQNLFDKAPPVRAGLPDSFVDQAYSTAGDPRLRRYTLSLRKSFGRK